MSASVQRVVALTQTLVRFASVTPDCAAVLDWTQQFLDNLGFRTQRLPFGEAEQQVDNLYAYWGNPDQRLLFCGHLDVVPVGDRSQWSVDPFAAEIIDGRLMGRGAVDMKGNIAAYFAALEQLLPNLDAERFGLAVLLTGDEEGPAQFGVKAVVPHLVSQGEHWIGCVTGEPTSQQRLGDTFKPGRRGSLSGRMIVHGVQGHTGYPEQAVNAAHAMIIALAALRAMPLDQGCADFQPSWLAVSSIDIGNPASNVIPGKASALLNFRFNTQQTSVGLREKSAQCVEQALAQSSLAQAHIEWQWEQPSEPFLSTNSTPQHRSPDDSAPATLAGIVTHAIHQITGLEAQASTVGGTSDSRFIHQHCPVIDFGLRSEGMHGTDESVALDDLYQLQTIYHAIIHQYAASMLPIRGPNYA